MQYPHLSAGKITTYERNFLTHKCNILLLLLEKCSTLTDFSGSRMQFRSLSSGTSNNFKGNFSTHKCNILLLLLAKCSTLTYFSGFMDAISVSFCKNK